MFYHRGPTLTHKKYASIDDNHKKHKHIKTNNINKKKYVSIDDARATLNVCPLECKIPGTLVPIQWQIVFTVNTLYIGLWAESNFSYADLFHFNLSEDDSKMKHRQRQKRPGH